MKRCPGERWRWFQLEWKGAKWDRLTVQLMVVVVLWKLRSVSKILLHQKDNIRDLTVRQYVALEEATDYVLSLAGSCDVM
jgi:hypothetical protein